MTKKIRIPTSAEIAHDLMFYGGCITHKDYGYIPMEDYIKNTNDKDYVFLNGNSKTDIDSLSKSEKFDMNKTIRLIEKYRIRAFEN